MTRRLRWISFVLLLGMLAVSPLAATTVLQMDLGDLCDRADKIFRGTLVSVEPGTVSMGGAELPTVTYALEVAEGFKGDAEAKGVVEMTVIGSIKGAGPDASGRFQLLGAPDLQLGHDYVLFTTTPSSAGLSNFVGLGQGCFSVFTGGKQELAVNEVSNSGLLEEHDGGPILYSQLVASIQNELGTGGN
jgi:hypothetical protein